MMETTPFEEFMDDGVRKTDKSLKRYIKSILKAYAVLYAALAQLLRDFYNDYTDADASLYKSRWNWGVASGRLNKLKADMASTYREKMADIENDMRAYMEAIEKEAYGRMGYALSWKHPDASFTRLPQELTELTIEGTREAWDRYVGSGRSTVFGDASMWLPKRGTLGDIMAGNHDEALNEITRSVITSISSGMGITAALAQLKEHVGKVVKSKDKDTGEEKTKVRGAAAKEVRVLRTEGNRLMNVGILAVGMLFLSEPSMPTLKKMWVAILDSRTRQQSIEMNNQVRALDEPYLYPNGATGMYPGDSGVAAYDINERCTSVIVDPDDDSSSRGVDPLTGDDRTYTWTDYDEWSEEFE